MYTSRFHYNYLKSKIAVTVGYLFTNLFCQSSAFFTVYHLHFLKYQGSIIFKKNFASKYFVTSSMLFSKNIF